jgi:nucleotide-binding universal stress UspA family protein
MKTILVPTDFSSSSERALDFAINIAKKSNAKIILVHAYYIPTFDLDAPPGMLQNMYDEQDKEIKSKLHVLCTKTAENISEGGASLSCEHIAELKLPVSEIYEIATKRNVDLIVMGTEGKDNLMGFFGSVTMEVLNKVESPVLVVKENFGYKDFKRICYAVEDLDRDIPSISELIPFAKFFNAEIDIIHVEKYKKNQVELQVSQNSVIAMRKLIDYKKINLHQIVSDDIVEGLAEFFSIEPWDLIVFMKHKRNWFESIFHKSVIKHFIAEGRTPLLIIHHPHSLPSN